MRPASTIALATLVALLALATGAPARAATQDASQPAVWAPHALIVDLRNLPKHYTCDDLWYKFRDVLLAMGARPDMKILPYRCAGHAGSQAYSPKVELQFSMPRTISGADVKWADLRVIAKPVHLQPGAPAHLDQQDCELLSQIKSTLLQSLSAPVLQFNLACQAPPAPRAPFGLTVRALLPVSPSSSQVASAPQQAKRGI